jgi:uncharacterized membrane protein YedE/YeeE
MLAAIVGGVLIGGSAGLLMLARERIAGIGGMVSRVASRDDDAVDGERVHRILFLAGLALAGLVAWFVHPSSFGAPALSLPLVALGGVLVGFGVERGSGCTSGHGVCGLSRFSKRSLVATLTFMATGALTVLVMR